MSKALDYLAGQGIDCIKITDKKYDKIFLPINMLDDKYFIKEIFDRGGILLKDGMRIKGDYMSGKEIRKLNDKMKVTDTYDLYDVLKISYTKPFNNIPMSLETSEFQGRVPESHINGVFFS